MTFEQGVFYLFAALAVFGAVRVITVRNPVHAALHLVLTFFCMAAIWLMSEAEFLAIVLVLVYVGAVMVLFLFVVMMLDVNLTAIREGFTKYLPLGVFVAGVLIYLMVTVLNGGFGDTPPAPSTALQHAADYSNTKELGRVLYTKYLYPFELAAVILLLAMVAAIALTMRNRPGKKQQNVGDQVRVKAADRLRTVSVNSEGDTNMGDAFGKASSNKTSGSSTGEET